MNKAQRNSSRTFTGIMIVIVILNLLSIPAPNVLAAQSNAPQQAAPDCQNPPNEIVAENCLTGNPPSEWDISGIGDTSIQGYATDISVNRGQTINFKVKTDATAYRIDIYRLGYYGGNGARKVATVLPSATLPQNQPACLVDNTTRLVDCGNWAVSASWAVPVNAVSGIYIAKLVRTDTNGASHMIFIVRNDASTSKLLFQTSDLSWQAYNHYGGWSLYGTTTNQFDKLNRAYKVSYNRPFWTRGMEQGITWVFNAEYPMLRWLERNGYDVSYFTGVDSARFGNLIRNHKVFLSVGHDEYWSGEQRTNVEAARDAGVNLAFFSGNEIFWKTRWEPSIDGSATSYRTLVCYKETHANAKIDPSSQWTGTWRDARFSPPSDGGRPENSLSGTIFTVNGPRVPADAISVPAADGQLRFWRNTTIASLGAGQTATLPVGTLGYEWDSDLDNGYRPAGMMQLSHSTVDIANDYLLDNGSTFGAGTATHSLTLYRAASGALVFGAGSVQWSWGLDATHDAAYYAAPAADVRMQQATVNLFADMGVQPGSLQTGLTAATATTDTTAPVSTITSPLNGAAVNGTVTISGTATDTGGVVGAVEVSVDGGVTWRLANGRGNWSYSWTPAPGGSVNIKSRAADDSGNIETPSAGINVNVAGGGSCPCSIWGGTGTPDVPNDTDGQPIEVGVKFRSSVNGYITGLRFYKGNLNTGTHIGHLWSSTGVQLAEALFSGESVSGWQEVTLSTPVPVSANTTYIASYYSSNNYFAWSNNYFSTAINTPPLRALANGEDGPNGVYRYGTGFPNQTFNASNYWVDIVFNTTVGPDTTAPTVVSVTPANNATDVSTSSNISALFSEPLDAATVSSATFELRDSANTLVPASITYDSLTRTAILDPTSVLGYSTVYTAKLIGGTNGIKDAAGNALAANYTWSFTTASAPPPPPNEGPGGPILVISSAGNPFGRYLAEILRTEGLNAFTATDVTNVNATVLAGYDVVILGETPLTSAQVTMFTNWVTAGGNLIAMRPDKQLSGLLGLGDAGTTLSNAYLLVNTSSGPGQGIVNQTIQFHGTADRYTLNGATAIATLYSNATTATVNPAVTLINVGTNGGQAAAFTFDLARSVVYTRQGNPAWAGDERDGSSPIRPDDQFYGAKTGDSQPDWVDLNKVAIPQADEQQRLLANLILQTNLDKKPLPRFWYFPRGEKAVVVMTSDDHGTSNVTARLDQLKSLSPANCSVSDWECIRSSVYIYPGTTLTTTQANTYTSDGFEIGVHVNTNCANFTQAELLNYFTTQLSDFATRFPSLPAQSSQRIHCIAWSNWAFVPTVEAQKGIRLDTTFYFWPPSWVGNRPGMFTGSGMPMRYANLDGSMIDVYQATTQMTDESGQTYPYTIDTLLDRALGSDGYYGFFTANIHSDYQPASASDAIISSAQSRGVPVISGRQLLTWLDGRSASSFTNLNWSGNTLNFGISASSSARGLQAMLPALKGNLSLQNLTRDGVAVAFTIETIKGISYVQFPAVSGAYVAQYASDTTPPTVNAVSPASGATGVALTTTVTATFSEAIDPLSLNSANFELRDSTNTVVPASISYDANTRMAALTPNAGLASNVQYTAKLKGGAGGVSDLSGNPLASDYVWSFTTTAINCPCRIWSNATPSASAPVSDGQTIEVGTKFRSDVAGYITAIRFYKGAGDADTHVGHLWASTGGVPLATVTFTNETASGWQEMALPNPVQINANTTYVVSIYSSPTGNFAYTPGGLTNGVNTPPLRALASGVDGPNGVYIYGGGFPTNGSNANYWVDVVFNTTLPSVTPTATATLITYTPTTLPSTPTYTPSPTFVPGGFPSTGILDNFTRANGVLGTNWSGVTGGYGISSNRVDVGTGGDIYWSPASFGTSQEVYVTLSTMDPAATEIDLLLKSQNGTSWSGGVIEVWYDPANSRVQVWTYSSAQNWVQRGADIPITFANGDRFGARALSNGQVEVYKNSTLLGTRDVSAWTYNANGGYVGMWFVGAGNAFLDDFGGGTVVSGPIATSTPTFTATPTLTATFTGTPTPTFTSTFTPTATLTATATAVPPTPTFTPTQTSVPPTATSTPIPCYSLTRAVSPVGSGSVTVTAPNCGNGYTAGTVVQLTAVPNAGYTFLNWSGGSSGTSNPVSITMDANKSVTANFRVTWLAPSANAAVTSSAGDNNGYEGSPANAYVADGVFATDTNSGNNTNTSCTNTGKDRHLFYNFNFNITSLTTVRGIEVRLNAKVNNTGNTPRICVQISWDGGTTWTTAKSTPTLTTANATYVLGTPTDNWGRTWGIGDFTNTNFRIRVIDVAGSTSRTFSLDSVEVNVTYQP